ncbi:class I SAM-dependent methyltransferase [Smaragdicoccus niigatensis]|uniref:class I SAM-dependent methyltransferase n=1 Tax=Smaragdicoccus niigatensis TaxID=359359 RepID=UPI000380CC6B|nr:class I SAM-dependent methyltransferase [Smaragdicoccus niigatensis]
MPLNVRRAEGYSRWESGIYERFIAPGALRLVVPLLNQIADDLEPTSTVIDIGCGGGQQLAHLHDVAPNLRLTGLDASKYELAAAKTRLGDRATLVEASADAMPIASESFDATLSFFSIKHWPDQKLGLAECVRITKPGGRLLITELDAGTTIREWRQFARTTAVPPILRMLYAVGSHPVAIRSSINADDMTRLFAGLPLRDVTISRVGSSPLLVGQATIEG